MTALNHGIVILSWYEHLPEDDMPPKWMWHLDDVLEEHFDGVKERRKAGTSGDDDSSGPMMKNEYARGRGRNAR